MAEFKLGRIRFVWKGNWSSATQYFKDDVVRYGGRTYICEVGHTSDSNFYTDLDFSPTKWNQMTDGQSWEGDWSSATTYKINDVVKYGGNLYICETPHTPSAGDSSPQDTGSAATNGLEADSGNWSVYAEGIDFKGSWSIGTRYKINDVVSYGGIQYICTGGHTSSATTALGLEEDSSYWTDFSQGIEYKGDWSADTGSGGTRYKLNDVVKYGAGLWIATTAHTSTAVFADDVSNWGEFVKGFEFEDEWSDSTRYQPGDVVKYGGNQYIALTNHINTVPTAAGNTDWQLFSEGFRFQEEWDISTSYKIGEVVQQSGYTYLATADSPSVSISIITTTASNNRFTTADTTDISAGLAIQFSGTTFGTVSSNATYYIKEVVNSTQFTITDTPGGSTFVPTDGTGSMSATIGAIPPDAGYWSELGAGLKWRGAWQDDAEYVVGDTVRYDSNTFICVQNHRSEGDDGSTVRVEGGGADNSRPDQDLTGTYWNLLSVGSETSVLSTRGDLVYFGGTGPSRLPVGIEGQVLVAGENDPEWRTLGSVEHVYYVANHGVDSPAPIYGKSLDQPWKSIRYATDQIEKGPKVPITKTLLEHNRVFIQREVTEFIQYQIANADPGSIWENFEYEDFKCERDIGFFVDALIWDLSHGGNVKTRGVANSLVGEITEDSPGAYPGLAVEAQQSIAAYNYAVTVITAVLNQVAPDINYQVLNGDNSSAIVEQYFDPLLTAETDYSGATGSGYELSRVSDGSGDTGGFGGSGGGY